MKKLIVTLTLILTLCSTNLSHAADRYVTLLRIAGDTSTASQVIAADEVVTCVLAHCTYGGRRPDIDVVIGGQALDMGQISTFRSAPNATTRNGFYQWSIAGPCTVTLKGTVSADTHYIVTLKISPNPNIMGVKQ